MGVKRKLLKKGSEKLYNGVMQLKNKGKEFELMKKFKIAKEKIVPSKYKKFGKGPGATKRTTKSATVQKSFGQQQRSTDNMFGKDALSKNGMTQIKKLYK